MKKMAETFSTQKLAGEVEIARLRLARLESELKSCREQWRAARRRRKEAKEAARHVKHQLKLVKASVSDAAQSLADAEARLFKAGERELKLKQFSQKAARKPPPVKAANARPRKKVVRPPARRLPTANLFAPAPTENGESNGQNMVAVDFQQSPPISGPSARQVAVLEPPAAAIQFS